MPASEKATLLGPPPPPRAALPLRPLDGEREGEREKEREGEREGERLLLLLLLLPWGPLLCCCCAASEAGMRLGRPETWERALDRAARLSGASRACTADSSREPTSPLRKAAAAEESWEGMRAPCEVGEAAMAAEAASTGAEM